MLDFDSTRMKLKDAQVEWRVDDGILVMTINRHVGPREFMASVAAVEADESVPRGCPLLVDVRQSMSAPSGAEIREVSDMMDQFDHVIGPRRAILTATNLQFGTGRMGAAFEELKARELGVFRDPDEARAWLLREE